MGKDRVCRKKNDFIFGCFYLLLSISLGFMTLFVTANAINSTSTFMVFSGFLLPLVYLVFIVLIAKPISKMISDFFK